MDIQPEKKNETLQVKIGAAEKLFLRRAANNQGLELSAWVRYALLKEAKQILQTQQP